MPSVSCQRHSGHWEQEHSWKLSPLDFHLLEVLFFKLQDLFHLCRWDPAWNLRAEESQSRGMPSLSSQTSQALLAKSKKEVVHLKIN